jgi:ribosomal protein S6
LNTYEALFIFGAQLKDEEVAAATARVTEEITSRGGTVTATDTIGKRTFARTMKKQDAGIYVRLHIEMEPSLVEAVLRRYRLNEDVFRVQITCVTPKAEVEEEPETDEAPAEETAAPAGEALAAEETVA